MARASRPALPLGWRAELAAILVIALAAVAWLAHAPAQAHASKAGLDRVERKVVKLINRYRAQNGLARVRPSRSLNRSADRHSREMARRGFFSHSSANGTAAHARVRRSSRADDVGENIAFLVSGERRPARRVVAMWISSAPHRAVLLNPSFRRVGVARRAGAVAGRAGSAYTADFASRR